VGSPGGARPNSPLSLSNLGALGPLLTSSYPTDSQSYIRPGDDLKLGGASSAILGLRRNSLVGSYHNNDAAHPLGGGDGDGDGTKPRSR